MPQSQCQAQHSKPYLPWPRPLALDLPQVPFEGVAEAGFGKASSGLHTQLHTAG